MGKIPSNTKCFCFFFWFYKMLLHRRQHPQISNCRRWLKNCFSPEPSLECVETHPLALLASSQLVDGEWWHLGFYVFPLHPWPSLFFLLEVDWATHGSSGLLNCHLEWVEFILVDRPVLVYKFWTGEERIRAIHYKIQRWPE